MKAKNKKMNLKLISNDVNANDLHLIRLFLKPSELKVTYLD